MSTDIQKVLELHGKWLLDELEGQKAKLSRAKLSDAKLSDANLSRADLSDANLSRADLSRADLSRADLSRAKLSDADLSDADLSGADLSGADLSGADLSGADLSGADLSDADLLYADLLYADLSDADLSQATGLLDPIEFIRKHFEHSTNGIIVYKCFGLHKAPPRSWRIEAGAVLTEVVDDNRARNCGCGINVATSEWIDKNNEKKLAVWKCLIRWEWLSNVVIPYNTDGKIRCGRLELMEEIT